MARFRFPARVLAGLMMSGCALRGNETKTARPFDASPMSRAERFARVLELEDQRSLGSGELATFLKDPEAALRRRAALAIGRIGDPFGVDALLTLLDDHEPLVRRAAAFALGLTADQDPGGETKASLRLTQALEDPDPSVRGRAAEALGRLGAHRRAPEIAAAARRAIPGGGPVLVVRGDDSSDPEDPWVELRLEIFALARLRAVDAALSVLVNPDGSARLDWWASAWAAMRLEDRRFVPLLDAASRSTDPFSRSLAARGFGALGDPRDARELIRLSEDDNEGVALEAVRALPSCFGPGVLEALMRHVGRGSEASPAIRREALIALSVLPGDTRVRSRIIEGIGDPNAWIRAASWQALARVDGEDIGITLSTAGDDPDFRVRAAIAEAVGDSAGRGASGLLTGMLRDEDPRVIASVLKAVGKSQGRAAQGAIEGFLGHADAGVRAAAISALVNIQGGAFEKRAWGRALAASLADGEAETLVILADALGGWPGDEGARGLLRRLAGSGVPRVVRARAERALTLGVAPSDSAAVGSGAVASDPLKLPRVDALRAMNVYAPHAEDLDFTPRVVLTTRLGRVEIALDIVEAPLGAAMFVRLARSGFYNGLKIHGVASGHMVKGGDPRGDGMGGPGDQVRSEVSMTPFARGSVGIAVSLKDTGGSQFFITTAPQPQLDGFFTHLGRVIEGMDVVDRLQPGDVVERVEVFDGRDLLP